MLLKSDCKDKKKAKQTITNKLNKNAGVEMLDLVFEVGFGDAPEVYGDMFVGFEVAVNK